MPDRMTTPKEGDLYRTYQIDGHRFDIYYGYYDESERDRVEPLPIFPDLKQKAIHTETGERIVTSLQLPCPHYSPKDPDRPELWCGDCCSYAGGRAEMGVCTNVNNIYNCIA